MIRRITTHALGPLADTTLAFPAPAGPIWPWVTVQGASESGKTVGTLEAVCFALWGTTPEGKPYPVERIRDGSRRLEAEVELGTGLVVGRTLTASRATTRWTRRRGADRERHGTEGAMSLALGPLGDRATLCRLAMAPMSWVAPLRGEGGGRPLLQLLTGLLGEQDLRGVVARLMAEGDNALYRDDPLTTDGAYTARKRANAQRDEQKGTVGTLALAVAHLEVQTDDAAPSAAEVSAARASVEIHQEWARWDTLADRHQRQVYAYEQAQERHTAWRVRRDALGERPGDGADQVEAARASREASRAAVGVARLGVHDARDQMSAATAALTRAAAEHDPVVAAYDDAHDAAINRCFGAEAALAGMPTDGRCGQCGQPWDEATAALVAAEEEATDARAALAAIEAEISAAQDGAEKRKAERLAPLQASVATAETALTESRSALLSAEGAAEAAQAGLESALALGSDAATWDQAQAALGREPATMDAPGDPPAEPDQDRPAPEAKSAALDTISRAARAEGAAEGRDRNKTDAAEALADARAHLAELETERARLEALVAACRRAPGIAANEQLAQLGDTGPVRIRFPEAGDAVEVLIDDRPWWCASTGRQIVADLWLRAGLRRALNLSWLPLFVDRAQDWSGEWPAIEGPVILMTTASGPLTVREE